MISLCKTESSQTDSWYRLYAAFGCHTPGFHGYISFSNTPKYSPWDIKEKVRAATAGQPGPSACPDNHLYVTEKLRSGMLEWGHSSRVACHPGSQRTGGLWGSGGRPQMMTSGILSRPVPSAISINNPFRLQQGSFNHLQFLVGPGPTSPWTLSLDCLAQVGTLSYSTIMGIIKGEKLGRF